MNIVQFSFGSYVRWSLIACVALLAFGLGYVAHSWVSVPFRISCDARYSFLNPFLRCDSDVPQKQEFVAFKKELESFIQTSIASGNAKSVSVYFRDLENGPWFGIDEQALFSPASMIKLPLLVAYYKRAEVDPDVLKQRVGVQGSTLPSGAYVIDDLLRSTIIDSSNDALPILFSYLQKFYPEEDVFSETITAMGLAASEGSEGDFLTVKRYASIYRMLYNASFLSKEMSQRALDLLTQTESPQGIDDGVPAGTPVAHKFGIREQPGSLQLHDCGIVYHPGGHYILCVMTKGKDAQELSAIIRRISSMVYAEVDARSKAE
ncbi:MAG: beta-lactamase [Candidatus Peregrinibacteria bacterium Gr01-1014_25]|nr:MAG: beta-lactamase [Candidatus Peregrinibacteria bacterium Gr01-1014_25]